MSEINREAIRQMRQERDESRWNSEREIRCSDSDDEFGEPRRRRFKRSRRFRRLPRSFDQLDE